MTSPSRFDLSTRNGGQLYRPSSGGGHLGLLLDAPARDVVQIASGDNVEYKVNFR